MKYFSPQFALSCVLCLLSYVTVAQQNIILIIADDLGTDYCGFYEDAQDTAKMPNIRSLLAKGIRFQNAWAAPLCSPTRASMLTGRYPFRTGVGTALTGSTYPDLDTSEITIAHLLKYDAPVKYATANIGKWHINQQTAQKINYPNTVFGYDLYSGSFLGDLPDYYSYNKIVNGVSGTVNNYATTETVNDAIGWLDTLNPNKPFFIWLAFNAPHSPYHKPPDSLHSVPGLTGTQQHINQNTSEYFKAMIEAMDTETGRLFQWLITHNRMDSTNIIFMGDNGQVKKVSQISDTSHAKGTLYEYGVHVPFIVSGPAVVNPNRVSSALVNTPDLFSTISEMAGFGNWQSSIPIGTMIDSRSIMPIVKNQAATVRNWIFTEMFTPVPIPEDGKTIRNADYKLIAFDDVHKEFYNLSADTFEQTDLLLQTLGAAETTNYNYLCNELANLVGGSACTALGISDFEFRNEDFKIQPNPTNDNLSVEVDEELISEEISVYDLSGRKILSAAVSTLNFQLETLNLSSGIYFVRIGNNTHKFVKKE